MPESQPPVSSDNPEVRHEPSDSGETRRALLELAYSASSDALLIPITDALGWRDRMNTPGTVGPHNWTFRLPWPSNRLSAIPEATERQAALRQWSQQYRRL